MPSGLALGAVMERADPRDALLFSQSVSSATSTRGGAEPTPEDLPLGARVGTSSLRRRALLKRWRPDLEVVDLRGNVPTRIRKLDEGEYDAIVLAAAGVHRLGLRSRISAYLPVGTFLPAVSQGAVAVQIRAEDSRVEPWATALEHGDTRVTTGAERAFLRRLEGGCQIPVGAFGRLSEGSLHLRGIVASLDGDRSVQGEMEGHQREAERLGTELAEDLLTRGAREILDEIRGGLDPAVQGRIHD
jgi:hydroxymethylbilane synthase